MSTPIGLREPSAHAGVRERCPAAAERADAWPVSPGIPGWPEETLLRLQRLAGNGAVVQLLRSANAAPPQIQRLDDEDGEELGSPVTADEPVTSGEPAAEEPAAEEPAAGEEAGEPLMSVAEPAQEPEGDGPEAGEPVAGSAADGPEPASAQGGDSSDGGWWPFGSGADLPDIDLPDIDLPDIDLPDIDLPDIDLPSPFGAGGEPAEGGGGDAEADDGRSAEDRERKDAEAEGLSDVDPMVPMGGGAPPYSADGGGFHAGGRVATVPFGESASCLLDAAPDHPHAFTGGGRAGSARWSGGGPAGGPKGNQGTGSLQSEVAPAYDTQSNGPTSNADAWVRAGTGTVGVIRNYAASDAGDQNNGWWVSPAAASYLEAHEQRHVAAASNVYTSTIGSMEDRIANSADYGRGKLYWARDAITYLSNYVAWQRTLNAFKEQDAQWNANQGEVDQRDLGSGSYPRNQTGPRTIAGKSYENYLVKPGEEPPA